MNGDIVENELNRLGTMINAESSSESQMVLTILHGLATVVNYTANELKSHIETSTALDRRYDDHMIKVDTNWKFLAAIASALGVIFMSSFGYAYIQMMDIRDIVKKNDVLSAYVQNQKINTNTIEIENNKKAQDKINKER
jgi:hypothetical protein